MKPTGQDAGRLPPVVTIVIPTHNDAVYLAESVGSVLAQDFDGGAEILIVDDGSEPPADAVCPAVDTPGVRLIRQAPAGAGAARNRGIREAAGRYIAFLDADDIMLPGRLSRQVRLLESFPEAGLLAADTTRRDTDGREDTWGLFESFPRPVRATEVEPRAHLLDEDFTRLFVLAYPFHTSVTIRADIPAAGNVHFDPSYCCYEEWDFFVRLARQTRVLYDRTAATVHRKRPGSITTTPNPRKFLSRGDMQRRWRLEFGDLGDDVRLHLRRSEAESFATASWLFRAASRPRALAAAMRSLRACPSVAGLRTVAGAVVGRSGSPQQD